MDLRNGRSGSYPLGTSYQPTADIVMPWPRLPPTPAQLLEQMRLARGPYNSSTIRALARGRILPEQVHDFWTNVVRYVGVGAGGIGTRVF